MPNPPKPLVAGFCPKVEPNVDPVLSVDVPPKVFVVKVFVPNAGAVLPKAGAPVPKFEAVLPKVGAVLPNAGPVLPNVGAVLPNVGAVLPKVEAPPPKAKLPVPPIDVAVEVPKELNPVVGFVVVVPKVEPPNIEGAVEAAEAAKVPNGVLIVQLYICLLSFYVQFNSSTKIGRAHV